MPAQPESPMRILLVEDNPSDAMLVEEALEEASRKGYQVSTVSNLGQAQSELEAKPFDIVLLDLSLPDITGLETIDQLRGAAPGVPIVVMTGLSDEESALSAIHKGAQDYLVKGQVYENVIPRTLRYAVERHRILEELEHHTRRELEIKDALLSHVSHELRTPLTAIHQFVSIVLDGIAGAINPKQSEYLDIVFRNVRQLTKMVNDLLDVSRAQTEKLVLDVRVADLGRAATEVARELEGSAEAKQLRLRSFVEDDLPMAIADPARVRQVMSNLIENAIKFTPNGGRTEVTTCTDPGDPAFVRISVSDTGVGIHAEAVERIFERLAQDDPKHEEPRKGLGLGLFISRQLVTLHGGRIWVESKLREGSTFHFTVPVFSLEKQLAPTLLKDGQLRKEYSIIRVGVRPADPRNSLGVPSSYLAAVYETVGDAVLYPEDVRLPRLARSAAGEAFFVVAGTNQVGMEALTRRVRERLAAQEGLRHPNVVIEVSGCVEEAPSGDDAEASLVAAAERVWELIESPSLRRRDESGQDPHHR